jgi:hypothetical protein
MDWNSFLAGKGVEIKTAAFGSLALFDDLGPIPNGLIPKFCLNRSCIGGKELSSAFKRCRSRNSAIEICIFLRLPRELLIVRYPNWRRFAIY